MDDIYRCYFWLIYSGMKREDTVLTTRNQIDFDTMSVRYKYTNLPIYREAIAAFRNVMTLDSFFYEHPNYSTQRKRLPGEKFLRGVKGETTFSGIKNGAEKKSSEAFAENRVSVHLTSANVELAGFFHRVFELERIGVPVSFAEKIMRDTCVPPGVELDENEKSLLRRRRTKLEKVYERRYIKWKLAYMT